MKAKNRQIIKGVIGISVLLVAIFGIVIWENGGRQALTYTDAYVVSRDIKAGEIVTAGMIGTIKIETETSVSNPAAPADIIGLEAAVDIPAGLQLVPGLFLGEDTLADGERVFAIPSEWILSCPRTIRQGDTVFFYPIKETKALDEDGNTETVMSGSETSVLSAKAAYIKDSSNREVVDVTPVRMDASADTSTFEIIVDNDGYKVLLDRVKEGYRFNLMYR
jgi:multidrug efflux pump subunit AcrA (membrane-fusion protein)